MDKAEKLKRIEVRLPENHFIFTYPPRTRTQVVNKLLDIGVKLDYIIMMLESQHVVSTEVRNNQTPRSPHAENPQTTKPTNKLKFNPKNLLKDFDSQFSKD